MQTTPRCYIRSQCERHLSAIKEANNKLQPLEKLNYVYRTCHRLDVNLHFYVFMFLSNKHEETSEKRRF